MTSVLINQETGRRDWMSNPANRLPPEYDEMQPHDYDPQFTADISTQMRIPDKLAAFNGNVIENNKMADLHHSDMQRTARMNVPDKIIVLGQEQSMGMRDLSNLHLDASGFRDLSEIPVSLTTPPRVLTMDEVSFPELSSDWNHKLDDSETTYLMSEGRLLSQNGYIQQTPQKQNDDGLRRQALLATPGDHLLINDHEDDLTVLKKQIAKLSYHVVKLQEENSKRSHREVFFYPVVLGYLLFQVAKWFLSNK